MDRPLAPLTPVVLGISLWLSAPLAAVESPKLVPDPSLGNVDGKAAIAGWPFAPDSDEFLSPFGLEMVLVLTGDQDKELRFPAGTWVAPPPGQYKLWLEGDGRMSPGFIVLNYSAAKFQDAGRVLALPLVPAGTVKLVRTPQRTESVLRLLHLDAVRDGVVQREITRRVQGEARYEGAWMPTGEVVAALFDPDRGAYVGLTRPVRVSAGDEVMVDPAPPASNRAHLIARLERPRVVAAAPAAGIDLRLRMDGRIRPADLVVPLVDRAYALWYDLPPGTAVLEADGDDTYLEPTELVLRGGQIASLQLDLRPRPSLDVSVVLPESLTGEARLSLIDGLDGNSLGEVQVLRDVTTYSFPHLPARKFVVVLEARPWVFFEEADLTTGEDSSVSFAPAPIELYGSVYWGDEPWPGTIELSIDAKRGFRLEVPTDEDGEYEATLFKGGQYAASIWLAGNEQPYLELLDGIHSSGRLDFRLPRNHYVVEVVDSATGRHLEEAGVAFSNESDEGKSSGQQGQTGPDGRFRLPPLMAGKLSIWVSHEGFLDASREDLLVPGDSAEETVLRFELSPESKTWPLHLISFTGAPLVGAEVAVADLSTGSIAWSGRSDESGFLAIPFEAAGNLLLMRHPQTGFDARGVPPSPDEDRPVSWSAPPQAPPLVVRTVEADGEASPWSGLVLWAEGVRLEGVLLGWLTLSSGGSDAHGLWRVSNLPAGREVILEALRPGTAALPSSPPQGVALSGAPPSPLAVVVR